MAKCKKHRPHIWRKLFLTLAVNLILRKLLKIFFWKCCFCFMKDFVFSILTSRDTKKMYIWNISYKKNVIRNGGRLFHYLLKYTEVKNDGKMSSPLAVSAQCWSKNLMNFMQILPISIKCPHYYSLITWQFWVCTITKKTKKSLRKYFLKSLILDPWNGFLIPYY